MTQYNAMLLGLAACWSGVALSGNLIAAPAKFQVQDLHLPLALQVGRAQFTWIGYVEWILFTLIVTICVLRVGLPSLILIAAGLLFLLQQLWLQPLLEARSDLIIAGEDVKSSRLHIWFSILEVGKFLLLIAFAFIGLLRLKSPV